MWVEDRETAKSSGRGGGGGGGDRGGGQRTYIGRCTLIHHCLRDVCLGSCSQQLLLSVGGRLLLHLVAGIRDAQVSITGLVVIASSPKYKVSVAPPGVLKGPDNTTMTGR